MTRGLAQKNNLADLPDPIQARINLGLRTADYNRIRGLYAVSGLSNLSLQRIANSTGNFQQQINTASTTLAGIDTSLYANRSGDTLTGTWTNTGGAISAGSFVVGGSTLTTSTDSLFTKAIGALALTANQAVSTAQGLNVTSISATGSAVVSSQKTLATLTPVSVGGVPYRIETT